jgi:hypothetical protein
VWLINHLGAKNLEKPYVGFTVNGEVRKGVCGYAEDGGALVEAMVSSAEELLGVLAEEQRREVMFQGMEADEFRLWSNPELYVNPGSLRLDECDKAVAEAVHGLLKAFFLGGWV